MTRIVLASASPRRRTLLRSAGFEVEVRPQHVDESAQPHETVEALVQRLARLKLASCREPELPVVAADTLVALDGAALGQPPSLAEAAAMLHRLSGREHQVHSAVAVGCRGAVRSALVTTTVRFRPLSDEEITTYLRNNDVLDKAGGYAVQGGAASFITAIDGPLDNVVGLPVHETRQLLAEVIV